MKQKPDIIVEVIFCDSYLETEAWYVLDAILCESYHETDD